MAGKGKDVKAAEAPAEGGGEEAVVPIDDGGGKSKKKLLIMIAVPVLLIGGGAAAYFTGMLDKVLGKTEAPAEAGKEGEHAAPEGKAGEHGEAAEPCEPEEGKPCEGGAVAFVKIPDLMVNLNNDTGGEQRYLRLAVQLELENAADQAAIEKVLPRVVDQFQTYLRELRIEDLRGSKGIYRLQMELLSRVNQAAAPVKVKDVLFQEILIQ